MVCPKRAGVRPTEDRVRQALFNILGDAVVGAKVLDMFAGTGALGIEALSRGANFAMFLEKSPATAKNLRANLERLQIDQAQYGLMVGDAVKLLAKGDGFPTGFDLILIDPPYEAGLYEGALAAITDKGVMKPDGILVLEYPTRHPAFEPGRGWQRMKTRVYGETTLGFWFYLPGKEE